MKKAKKSVLFLLIGVMLFAVVQEVFRAKNSDLVIEQMGGLEAIEDNTVDALFLGASTVAYGISPMRIYASTGITSYNLGMGMEPYDVSYYYLKWAFQTQEPKVVLLDADGIFGNYSGEYRSENDENRGIYSANSARVALLDMLPIGTVKFELVNNLMKIPSWKYDRIETLFPMIRYHSRWNELERRDFKLLKNVLFYSMGAFLYAQAVPASVTVEEVEEIVEEMKERNEGIAERRVDGLYNSVAIEKPLYKAAVDETGIHYLKSIKELCKEHGTELILLKMPSIYYPQTFANPWTYETSAMAKKTAMELEIPFYDLALDYDIVDFQTDTSDAGFHLNIRGAEKVSDALGRILREEYHCKATTNETYEDMMPVYERFRRVAMLESEQDFGEYLRRLSEEKQDWTILISACNEYTGAMNQDEYDILTDELGLELIDEGGYTDSYVAVINGGIVELEEVSNRKITEDITVDDFSISLTSAGWYSGSSASIEINGEEYAQNFGGLNVVVIDNETKQVIDSVAFDTQLVTKPCRRSWDDTNTYLRQYEQSLLS